MMTKSRMIGASLLVLVSCAKPEAEEAPDPIALVTLAPATAGAVATRVTLYGQLEAGAGSERTLSAPVEATVVAIDAPAGSRVGPGTLVVRLAGSPQSALDRAKAATDAQAAQAVLARAQRLRTDGLVGNAEVETARAAAAQASATQASLSGRAGGLALRAGVVGVVEAVLSKPGDLVAAGAPIVRIAVGSATRARLAIDPALAARIGTGALLEIQELGGGGALRRATVTGVSRVVDPATRLASVFADLPPSAGLSIGQPLSATLVQPRAQGGVTVPYAAILDDGGQPYVFVVAGGVAKKHEVQLGPQDGDRVLVINGVGAGEQIVVAGGTAVEDGMKVRTGPMPVETADAPRPKTQAGDVKSAKADTGDTKPAAQEVPR